MSGVMTTPINLPLYRLLLKTGATEAEAEEAARVDHTDLVTKADLLALEVRLQKFIMQAMVGMTAIFAFIVGLFRLFGG